MAALPSTAGQPFVIGQTGGADARHRLPQMALNSARMPGSGSGRWLHNGLGSSAGSLLLNIPTRRRHRRPELHHQRGVCRRRNAAAAKFTTRQASALVCSPVQRGPPDSWRTPSALHPVCFGASGCLPAPCAHDVRPPPRPGSGFTLVRIMAAPSPMRRKASPRFRQPQTNGTPKACLLM